MSAPPTADRIVLLFYNGNGLLEQAIEVAERIDRAVTPYCHVALAFGGMVWEEQAPGLIASSGALAARRLAAAIASKTIALTPTQQVTVLAFLRQHLADHYNVAALPLDLLNILTRHHLRIILAQAGDYTCSGFASAVLQELGYLLPTDPHLMSPNDVASLLAPLQLGAPSVDLLNGGAHGQ